MSNNYNHYIARGRSLEIIQKHLAISEAHLAAWIQAAKAVGATRLARQGFAYYGLICETDVVPEGWRKLKKEGCLVPARTKAGKAIQAELDAAPPYDPAKVSRDMVGRWAVDTEHGRLIFRYVYPEHIGDVIILHVPKSCEQEPPDAERIKDSDYWLMKEAHSAP